MHGCIFFCLPSGVGCPWKKVPRCATHFLGSIRVFYCLFRHFWPYLFFNHSHNKYTPLNACEFLQVNSHLLNKHMMTFVAYKRKFSNNYLDYPEPTVKIKRNRKINIFWSFGNDPFFNPKLIDFFNNVRFTTVPALCLINFEIDNH